MVLELKTKKELGQHSHTLAQGHQLVRYRGNTYLPADYETGEYDVPPDPDRTMWIMLNRDGVRRLGTRQFNILFGSDSELSSFDFMVAQNAIQFDEMCKTLLVRTPEGLRELRPDGAMHQPTGAFVANTLTPMLVTDQADKDRVFEVIAGWLNSDEEAHSMLRHFSTALAPGWSAVKYVMLLGEGRNGKSVLLKMLQSVFGWTNVSNVTRQQIAEQSPVVCELNGRLLNVVFDGMAEFVKDSGMEKSLIAGEQVSIRKLYESTPTVVQTNALFVEGLNHEPKSKDKSTALQKRIVRYQFPNTYAQDHKFERRMLAPDSLGAFLALLIDHYVLEDNVAKELAPTEKAMELQLEHMFVNSLALQYLKFLEEQGPGADSLINETIGDLTQGFQSWRIRENDLKNWPEPEVQALFQPVLDTERKSVRVSGSPRKVRVITGFKIEGTAFLDTLKGEEDDADAADRELLGEEEG